MINKLKRDLTQGKQVYGCWMTIESPICSEMMSSLGFDYFVFDTEHSPLEIYQIQTLMQAMRGDSKTTPIIRVNWNDIVQIKRALDVGAHGVIVPWVNNKDQAEMAVKATRYPPEGVRGCGPRRPELFDFDYIKTANKQMLVICQIETKEAVENIEEIVSVEGVDVTYIGPADLSASYGHLGDKSHPEVQNAIDTVYDATKAAGKIAGIHMGSGLTIQNRIEKGYEFITIAQDIQLLAKGANDTFKELHNGYL